MMRLLQYTKIGTQFSGNNKGMIVLESYDKLFKTLINIRFLEYSKP